MTPDGAAVDIRSFVELGRIMCEARCAWQQCAR